MKIGINLIFNTLATLSFRKIFKLLRVTVPHPLFSILAFYATTKSFLLARKQFPKTSSTNGMGNAYGHSLWTYLILMYCSKISSPEKALIFCTKLTNMYEELFPNEALENKMDLHNNQVGMELFMELLPGIHRQFFETSFFQEKLVEKLKTAKILKTLDEDFGRDLIYLE
jgi:hypothetical protein